MYARESYGFLGWTGRREFYMPTEDNPTGVVYFTKAEYDAYTGQLADPATGEPTQRYWDLYYSGRLPIPAGGAAGGWIPETGAPGSAAPSVAFDSPGVSSEELRAIMEAPDYLSPTVPGLSQPGTPGYVWGEGGQAVPGYSVTFDGEAYGGTPGAPPQSEVERWAVTGGREGAPPDDWGPADGGGGPEIEGEGPGMSTAGVSPLVLGLGLLGAFIVAGGRRRRR